MWLSKLSLRNFRNYLELELELPPGLVLLYGDNGQGKSNLLEAVYLLSLGRSTRASADRELVHWQVAREPIPWAKLRGHAQRRQGPVSVEVLLQAETLPGNSQADALRFHKRLTINGVPRLASELVNHVGAVLFDAHDIELVHGSPGERRRFLDIPLSRANIRYLKALQRLQHVVAQRNQLLKLIYQGRSSRRELDFWDEELATGAAYVVSQRLAALGELSRMASSLMAEIMGSVPGIPEGGEPNLELRYVSSVGEGGATEEAYRQAIASSFEREVSLGATLVGPHRDNFQLISDGIDLGTYASRGQARAIALALRMAEARYLKERTGEEPILLLDDALSELDSHRRRHLLELTSGFQQCILTCSGLEVVDIAFRSRATILRVAQGKIHQNPSDTP